ncbi:MAG TPA: SDR family oxidoreductase, partial [Isosphaeraceae bacterium]|nr:SDR family oxidoreductase [Isosphaeraceae bacterium]
MRQPSTILVTGASGALGKRFVRERLNTTDQTLHLLMRPKGATSAEARVRKFLAADGLDHHLGERVQVIEGDITRPMLGLGPEELERPGEEVEDFYHIAALTALNAEDDRSRRLNVEGTAEALKVADHLTRFGRLERFFYFSTAYVAGSHRAVHAREDELVSEPAHANAYEATKYEAEGMVRRALAEGLPATIFR